MKTFQDCVLLISLLFISSCGKSLEAASETNQCGFRYVSGRECIVCDKGGVSCKWD